MTIATPQGFRAAGVACGLKSTGAKDLALVVNDGSPDACAVAGVFTANRFPAAPVQWSRAVLADAHTRPRAIVLNSGGANASSGPEGLKDTEAMAARTAEQLGISPREVLVCSTGLIGERLALPLLLTGIDRAAAALDTTDEAAQDAAWAILTTDTRPKQAGTQGSYTVAGMAKGAGMLAPQLATMLVVLTTDALITDEIAQTALTRATALTFDRLDSDGCMSTNDTVLLLASGASGITPPLDEFAERVTTTCHDLAMQLLADAEGAEHDIAITVDGATTTDAALAVGRAIARANLVKAAIYGHDPNWGRILSAVGTVPEEVAPYQSDQVDIEINHVRVVKNGDPDQPRSLVDLTERAVTINVHLHAGPAQATIWTNDLTHAYVEENSAYPS
ncbi:MAG: bifunctional glutamate N-acetyltransferase/amino-acid acetyltransferase ArgJ [Micrococcales bacterium]|nr:bifunctional glutamate N-acetyltransferase/amino-acid acetyltransferase ArgJ [Micrococcales bacterium]